jgi:DNA-binding response OmpR family regulator
MNKREGTGILLIEDDPLVQKVVGSHLRRRGYEVWIADDSETARAMMDSHRGSVELLIVDSGLPVQSGESLAAELKDEFGPARVLMISGYRQKDDEFPFLQKPFSGAQLVSRVEDLLRTSKE